MEAAPAGFAVIPAVGAYGSRESVRWAEQAAEVGASAVMALPPNSYRADERSVVEHYRALAAVGLPVVAYNNPLDTKVDLAPRLLARLHEEGLIVAVKEFAGDPRRAYAVRELAPDLDVLIGSDDTVLEVAIAGAKGWISGYTSVFPRSCVELYHASVRGDLEIALPLYRALHPLLRWDSKTEFVQAIKLSMDIVGPRRRTLPPSACRRSIPEHEAEVRRLTEQAVGRGNELMSIGDGQCRAARILLAPGARVTSSASSASHRRRSPQDAVAACAVGAARVVGPRRRRPVGGAGGGRDRAASPRATRPSRSWCARSASRSVRPRARSRERSRSSSTTRRPVFAAVGEQYPPSLGGLLFTRARRRMASWRLITPWNFPLAIPLWKAAPALGVRKCGRCSSRPPRRRRAPRCSHEIIAPHVGEDVFTRRLRRR